MRHGDIWLRLTKQRRRRKDSLSGSNAVAQ
jgi:hypothetical protein